MKKLYGLDRVVLPKEVFPVAAWELDNSRELKRGEMRIKLQRIQLETMNFRQISQESRQDEFLIGEKIKDIVLRRGKMHNPVTDSGGILYGIIEEIDDDYVNTKGLKIGDEVICNASLTGIPLHIEHVNRIDRLYYQADVEGYAIAYSRLPIIKKPYNLPLDLLLFTLDESGTIYTVYHEAKNKKDFLIVGNNPIQSLIYGFTIRESAGSDANIYCIFDSYTEITLKGSKIEKLMNEVFTEISYHNLLHPVECLETIDYAPVDMSVNCVNVPGAETINVLMTKNNGVVVFTGYTNSYNMALYVTEYISRSMRIRSADGFIDKYDEFDLELVQKLSVHFEDLDFVPKKRAGLDHEKRRALLANNSYKMFSVSEEFVAESSAMVSVMEEIESVSKYDCNVLIMGQTGVGKEKVANIIQKNSQRRMQPFIKINCAAIAPNLMESEFFGYEKGAFTGASSTGKKGYFEAADNGIIFLDEVGELPLDIQAKLLRVIQEGEFMRVGGTKPIKCNVRIISATNRNLLEEVEKKLFRRDLYYRLNVFPIMVPALNERPEDIPFLAEAFINQYNKKFGVEKDIDKDAREYLSKLKWHGNIRELENVIQRLMITTKGDVITVMDVMGELHSNITEPKPNADCVDMDLPLMMEYYEKNILKRALDTYGSTRKAAKSIGISQTQLVRKKNKYNL